MLAAQKDTARAKEIWNRNYQNMLWQSLNSTTAQPQGSSATSWESAAITIMTSTT
jgi:hypothetical protein